MLKWSRNIFQATYKLGNDIVDFSPNETKNKYENTRFLKRVFNENEIKAILSAHHKDRLLWTLWSAKEAAFKACKKQDINLIFSPKSFRVSDESLEKLLHKNSLRILTGMLQHDEKRLSLQWQFPSEQCVHCCAVLMENNQLFTHWNKIHQSIKKIELNANISQIHSQQSNAVREELIALFSRNFGKCENLHVLRPEKLINGIRRKGPPVLFEANRPLLDYEISLSHDEEWVAAVIGAKA